MRPLTPVQLLRLRVLAQALLAHEARQRPKAKPRRPSRSEEWVEAMRARRRLTAALEALQEAKADNERLHAEVQRLTTLLRTRPILVKAVPAEVKP